MKKNEAKVVFAHAGWCDACVAEDLLVARSIAPDRLFFVCAACSACGESRPSAQMSALEQSIAEHHRSLAPEGWTLATVQEAEERGLVEVTPAAESYEALIARYDGHQARRNS